MLLLQEERIARHGIVITAGVHVGDACQAHTKALVGDDIVGSIDQVLLEQVLLIPVSVPAVGHEFDLVLPVQHGPPEGVLRQVDVQRWEAARLEPEFATRPHLELDRAHGAVVRRHGQDSGAILAVLLAISLELVEVGSQGDLQELMGREKRGQRSRLLSGGG